MPETEKPNDLEITETVEQETPQKVDINVEKKSQTDNAKVNELLEKVQQIEKETKLIQKQQEMLEKQQNQQEKYKNLKKNTTKILVGALITVSLFAPAFAERGQGDVRPVISQTVQNILNTSIENAINQSILNNEQKLELDNFKRNMDLQIKQLGIDYQYDTQKHNQELEKRHTDLEENFKQKTMEIDNLNQQESQNLQQQSGVSEQTARSYLKNWQQRKSDLLKWKQNQENDIANFDNNWKLDWNNRFLNLQQSAEKQALNLGAQHTAEQEQQKVNAQNQQNYNIQNGIEGVTNVIIK